MPASTSRTRARCRGRSPCRRSQTICPGTRSISAPASSRFLRLGLELTGSVVVLDDAAARARARSLGLTITGTLGILIEAKRSGLIAAVRPVMDQIQAEGFRLDPATRETVLSLAGERD